MVSPLTSAWEFITPYCASLISMSLMSKTLLASDADHSVDILTDGWMNRMWHTHAPEYHSATKRNRVLTLAPWGNCKVSILSELNQTPRDRCCRIPFLWGTQRRQIRGDTKQNGDYRAQEDEGWGVILCITEFLLVEWKSFGNRGAWVAQSVKHLPLVQVMIPGSWGRVLHRVL